jgi:hypothetical protein
VNDEVNDKVWGTATDEYVNDDVNVYVLADLYVDVLVDLIGCYAEGEKAEELGVRELTAAGALSFT